MSSSKQSKGAWYVGLSYALWGFFPIYWKALAGISALQLICHRIVWSFLLLAVMMARSQEFHVLWQAMRSPRIVVIYTVAALAIASNWLIFVWAVSMNQIVQISLGYFINPLLSVVFGMIVFHERLRRLQWVSVALAAAGVVYFTVRSMRFPGSRWAGGIVRYLRLDEEAGAAGSRAGADVRNRHPVHSAAAYLIVEALAGRGAFMHAGPLRNLLDARFWACDDIAAPDVCGGRPPHPVIAGRDAAVHQPDASNYDRRDFV